MAQPPTPNEEWKQTELLDSKAEIDQLANNIQRAIKIIGGTLAAIFTWLQVKDFPFIPLLESAPPEALRRFVIAIYYFSWVFGSSFDVRIQQSVYVRDPSRGRLKTTGVVAVLVLAVTFAMLLSVSGNLREFVGMLNAFVLADLLTWQFLFIARTTPIIRASEAVYVQDKQFFDLERLRIVESYMVGNWHWYRFIVLGVILAIMDIVAFIDPIPIIVGNLIDSTLPSLTRGLSASLIPVLTIVLFVLVGEGWKWFLRVKVETTLEVFAGLKGKYRLLTLNEERPA